MHQFGDFFHQARLVDHVGNFRDHDAVAAIAHGFDIRFGAHDDAALARAVRLMDAALAQNHRAGGKIRALNELHQIFHRAIRVINHVADAIDHLAQVVRRDVRGHAYRDARRAVDQQVGEARRQYLGLHQRFIKVGIKIHGFLVQVAGQFQADLAHARLGVAHGGGIVAIHGAEIALPIHQQIAHGKALRHAHHAVVHSVIAVRVVFAQHVAHDAGALSVRFIGRNAQLGHRIDDAAVHGLKAVAHIGQRAAHNHRHCVGNKRFFQLVFQLQRHKVANVLFVHTVLRPLNI